MEFTDEADPYKVPTYSLASRLARLAWGMVQSTVFRFSPRPWHPWRACLLRLFGARLGPGCHIYPRARVWAPWNLRCEDTVAIGDEAVVYNPTVVDLKSHAIVSFQAYLCGAGHDLTDPAFPVVKAPIIIGRYGWVCARATVKMGVTIGDGAVLGLNAVATGDLEPWSIYAGIPARRIGRRPKFPVHERTPPRSVEPKYARGRSS
jgi:putative colanic acid biosynthesis acetyltransferase WcaF